MYACVHVPGLTEAQRAPLNRCAGAFSPLIETAAECVVIDIHGLGPLMGSPRRIAEQIAAKIAESELVGNVGVAATPYAAMAAARGFHGVAVIPPGDEARALAPLTLELLNPEEETRATLELWGIRTFGDLSKLPEVGLAERLGPEGVRLHRLTRGLSPRPIVPTEEAPVYEASMELEYPLDSLESLAFILSRLLNDVCGDLVRNGLAANELALKLRLENKTGYERAIRLPFASTETAMFLKLLKYDLAAHPPQAAIEAVTLCAVHAPQRKLQGGLFIPVAPEPEKLELTLARLTAIVGEGNIGSPELLNTHRPDAFRMNHFTATPAATDRKAATVESLPLVLRLFRPPLRADVRPANGPPSWIRASGITGTIETYAGPWRKTGEWWEQVPWSRDEWDVMLENGAIYRIYRDGDGAWFVDGNYD